MRFLFASHDCQTTRFADLAGLGNGRLLEAAEAGGFDVMITVDQNTPGEQNLAGRKIALVTPCGTTNRLRHLEPLAPAALSTLSSIGPGDVVTSGCFGGLQPSDGSPERL